MIWAATNGLLDDVETTKIAEFESGLYRHLESGYSDVLPTIVKDRVLSDETVATLEKAVAEFKRQGGYGKTDDAAAPKTDDAATADPDEPKADGAEPEAEADEPEAEADETGEPQAEEPEAQPDASGGAADERVDAADKETTA